MADENPYRRGVGVMLVNRAGLVFVGARIDNPEDAWQMPQGGLEEGDEPWSAALRELREETGIAPVLVERLAETREPLRYDLPDEWRPRLWGGRWKGQEQTWFLCRFRGEDCDIDLCSCDHPEFRDWRWVEPETLPDLIVPFKRDLYLRLLDEFADRLESHRRFDGHSGRR